MSELLSIPAPLTLPTRRWLIVASVTLSLGCTPAWSQPSAGVSQGPASADSLPQRIEARIPGTDVSFEMSLIPGGFFWMGSPESEVGRDDDEGPQRYVWVDSFWMSTHEVSYDEFAIFRYPTLDKNDNSAVESSEHTADAVARPSPPYEDPAHGMGNQGFPAAGMTQWAALQYAKWLSDKTGEFYRLPTEAEWEYACRAGSSEAFSFGNRIEDLDEHAWYYGNSDEVFQRTGKKRPNAWGLYDMHGNVAEWTLDQYQADLLETVADSSHSPWVEPTSLHPRTVRGGAYDDDPDALRCAARLRSNMNWKRRDPQIPKSYWWNTDSPFVGFRLVRPVDPGSVEEQRAFWQLVLGE